MARKVVIYLLCVCLFLGACSPVYAASVPRYPMDNNTLLSFGRDMISKFGVYDHYVYYLSSQYTYTFVWGRDITLSSSTFRYNACNSVSFTYYPAYNDGYSHYPAYYGVSSSSVGSSGSVSAGGFVVYSDLGSYPDLRSEGCYYAFYLLVAVFVLLFMSILRFIFGCVRRC